MQCHTHEDAYQAVKNLVDCFECLGHAIQLHRHHLVYDSHIEERHLIANENFHATMGRLRAVDGGADISRQWYLYTKNRAQEASWASAIHVQVTSLTENESSMTGHISEDLVHANPHWFSFGGTALHEVSEFEVKVVAEPKEEIVHTIRNAHHSGSMMLLLPRYEPNPKHRKTAYIREGGEHVAPMPLSDIEAQALLIVSTYYDGNLWAYDGNGMFYRYILTHVDRNIYHGFQVMPSDVPEPVSRELNPD